MNIVISYFKKLEREAIGKTLEYNNVLFSKYYSVSKLKNFRKRITSVMFNLGKCTFMKVRVKFNILEKQIRLEIMQLVSNKSNDMCY